MLFSHFWFLWACLWGFFNDLCFFSIRECLSRFFSWHDVSETTKWWLNHIKPATVMASEKANRQHYSVNVNFLFYEKWHFSSIFGDFLVKISYFSKKNFYYIEVPGMLKILLYRGLLLHKKSVVPILSTIQRFLLYRGYVISRFYCTQ